MEVVVNYGWQKANMEPLHPWPRSTDPAEAYYAPIRREHFNDRLHRLGMKALRWLVVVSFSAGLAWVLGK